MVRSVIGGSSIRGMKRQSNPTERVEKGNQPKKRERDREKIKASCRLLPRDWIHIHCSSFHARAPRLPVAAAALNTMAFICASRSGEKTSRAQPNPTRRCSRISFPSPSATAAPTGGLPPPLPLPSPYSGPTARRRGRGVRGSRGVSPWMGRRSESSMAGRANGDLADAGKKRRCHPSMADTQLLKVSPSSLSFRFACPDAVSIRDSLPCSAPLFLQEFQICIVCFYHLKKSALI